MVRLLLGGIGWWLNSKKEMATSAKARLCLALAHHNIFFQGDFETCIQSRLKLFTE